MAARQAGRFYTVFAPFCAALLLASLAGCAAPRLQVEGAPAVSQVEEAEAGIRVTILPNTWAGYPSDLVRYYTPIEIRLQNERKDEIQVRYADFLAVDEARNQYRAVAPDEVVRALFGGSGRYGAASPVPRYGMNPPSQLYAFHDPWWRYAHRPFPYRSPFYWPYSYWPYPPYPYHDPEYVPGWPRAAAYDILRLGLRQGRVLAGARVEGFLYLQQATRKGNLLTLSWNPGITDGRPLATFRTQFRIIR
jgi:hypothetical protein